MENCEAPPADLADEVETTRELSVQWSHAFIFASVERLVEFGRLGPVFPPMDSQHNYVLRNEVHLCITVSIM